jgi:CIC family chloride channel protein
MALLALSDRLARIPSLARAAAIGGLIGWVAWFRPDLVGGGDGIAQGILAGGLPLHQLAVVFLARFLIGPVSYAAGTPGGLFAPLLAVGAAAGALFAGGVGVLLPGIDASPAGFAVVGMAALFTAVVRAPVTGIVLVLEMTGRSDLGLGMIAASAAALLVTAGLGSAPIYDSLRQRMLAGMPPPAPSGQAGRGPDGIRPRQEDPGQEERGQEDRGQEDRGRGDR